MDIIRRSTRGAYCSTSCSGHPALFHVGLGLCYLNGLDRALDLAGSAENAVLLPCRVGFPNSKKGLSAIIRGSGVHSGLFAGYVHPVEDVCWADGYADAVGNTDVEIDPYCSTVNV